MVLSLNPLIKKQRLAPKTMREPRSHIRKVGVRRRHQRAKNERQSLTPPQLSRIMQVDQAIIANILQCRRVSMHNILTLDW